MPSPFQVEMMDARTLAENPDNYRRHPDRQNKEIGRSLKEFGWLESVLYNKRTSRLINGHARVKLAAEKGEEVPVRVIDVDPKTEKRILVSLQRTGDLGLNDEEQLADLLREVIDEGGELPPGWNSGELEAMIASVAEDTAEDEEEIDEEEIDDPEAALPLDIPASTVRMFQLFLTVQSEPTFRKMVERLAAHYELTTATDTVYRAVASTYVATFGEEPHANDQVDEPTSAESSGVFGGPAAHQR